MQVLQVPHVFLPQIGGVQFYTLYLSKELQKKGVDVEVLSTWNRMRTFQGAFSGIKTTLAPGFPNIGGNPLSPSLFFKQLKMNRSFDLLHAHPPQLAATFYSSLVRKLLSNRPLVITSHGFATPDYVSSKMLPLLRLANAGARFSLTRADAIIALTQHERSLLARFAGSEITDRIYVIPNATSIPPNITRKFKTEQIRAQLGFDNQFVMLFVGVLRWQKGVRYLLQSLRHISNPNWILLIAGDGIQRDELKHSVPAKFAKRVRFLGKVNRETLFRYYTACDVVILPSLHEGFPTVLPEAWMFRKPVILSDIPTHREIIESYLPRAKDLLVKTRRAKDLAQSIQYHIDNPSLRRKLGKEGHRAALSNFTWPIVSDKILSLYYKTLS
jgi:glycosyltransferase involved in cell wall biosynthesis